MVLDKLNPAEAYFILNTGKTEQKELIRICLMELLSQRILGIEQEKIAEEKEVVYITRTAATKAYDGKEYQSPFLEPFRATEKLEISKYLKRVMKVAGGFNTLRYDYFYKPLRKKRFFRFSWGLSYFKIFFLSKRGLLIKRKLKQLLIKAEQVPNLLSQEPERALEIVELLGWYILLSNHINPHDLALLKQKVSEGVVQGSYSSKAGEIGLDGIGEAFINIVLDDLEIDFGFLESIGEIFGSIDFDFSFIDF